MALKFIKKYVQDLFIDWTLENKNAVLSLIEKSNSLVDLGCGDGNLTKIFAKKAEAKTFIGVDSLPVKNGFEIIKGNLNKKLPIPNSKFDVAISHYSLEHLYNTGLFISETYRILKPGGYTIVATDNLSSWPSILSLILGFQPFSLTCGISKVSIGNHLAVRANFGEVVSDTQDALDCRT